MIEMKFELNFSDVIKFMKDFRCDFINREGELIIDQKNNIYTNFNECKTIKDLEVKVVMAISAALSSEEGKKRKYLLSNLNNYFKTKLSLMDMELMYSSLCYSSKKEEMKQFIAKGFPMEEIQMDELQ